MECKTVFLNGDFLKNSVNVNLNRLATVETLLRHVLGDSYETVLERAYLTHQSRIVHPDIQLCKLEGKSTSAHLNLTLCTRVLGGKGGFGSQLRAAGGRMSKKRNEQENQDSCRDLDGNRLGTIRQAKELSEYLAKKPAETRAKKEAKKQKLNKVLAADSSSSRFDDHEYLEDLEQSVSNVRDAFQNSLLYRRGSTSASSFSSGSNGATTDEPAEKEARNNNSSINSWSRRMQASESSNEAEGEDSESQTSKSLYEWDDPLYGL
ncbi:Telomere maintenance protein SDE2 [Schizosaccharomyces pombe]|uniref:Splicing regulator sde2 n=1 Tax=Schizosaccharomyces pombe (strain 972 / ATCC 24843) TaxID=284812 RepID=SDE2_SCHPO|nr:silencing defective protein sde2 [Schizosaccharomyces pombe]O14113.1 RecName: Full=Splicing regulator sde2; AltName: Full=Silencing defective protein 2; AltName: Full=Telomere maintenance protein SDE2; Flags: Precursor [Schizosaccharomyces pombe 972h-]CAB11702.1 silencing defective protein Sde2 [Schizosaccharomyces pombe]|eukprot:NP_594019.1 silencing defective protein sde2 [Schizosaccharomyces pombe]